MKTIIKKGEGKTRLEKKAEIKYIHKCWNCGCEFTYQLEDIKFNWLGENEVIICPACEFENLSPLIKKKYKGD